MQNAGSPGNSARGAKIAAVEAHSLLERHGVRPGDHILSINGEPVRDALDLAFLEADEEVEIQIRGAVPHDIRTICLEKSFDTPLGIELESFAPRRCANRCVFCFIDQNPPGLRDTLYVKDEDFRLSFAHGHYITGADLRETDLERIETMRLSPLYISVHATDPEIRGRMLGRKPAQARVMPLLQRLEASGIDFHTQLVLVPDWNDGDVLEQTLSDLESLGDALLSVAVVPVGLTAHRGGLEKLRLFTAGEAGRLIEQVEHRQRRFLEERGERVVLAADEWYLLAGIEPPRYSDEERDCQFENGVGMIDELRRAWELSQEAWPASLPAPARFTVLTGQLAARILEPLVAALCKNIRNLEGEVRAVKNTLYGSTVTVSGLLGGADFDRALETLEQKADAPKFVFIPRNALREEGDLFLDGLSLAQLRERHPRLCIEPVDARPDEMLHHIIQRTKEKP
ncbi:MAG: DUF512 domain-containing protein, partial [Candidatus Sumerlaeota bacterium]